jgi:hypothetical protein
MPRTNEQVKEEGAFQRVTTAVKRLFGRGRSSEPVADEPVMSAAAPKRKRPRSDGVTARATKREADIPLDVVDRSYTPPMTSSKASFRTDGADHQRDQEFAFTSTEERWNDEDHYTNKSGDPRIGTRQRTYEPGESRAESSK